MTDRPGGGLLGSKSVGKISDLVISTREELTGVALTVLARKLFTLSSHDVGSGDPLRLELCRGEYLPRE